MSTFEVHREFGSVLTIEADEMVADVDGLFFHKKGDDGKVDVLVAAVKDWSHAIQTDTTEGASV